MEKNKIRMLIVEDEANIATTLKQALLKENVEVMLADTIADAAEILSTEKVSIIILDRQLPDGDGIVLLRKLRANRELSKIPVLILSGMAESEDQADGLNLGADDYMTKPFSYQELRARVDVLLRRARTFITPGI